VQGPLLTQLGVRVGRLAPSQDLTKMVKNIMKSSVKRRKQLRELQQLKNKVANLAAGSKPKKKKAPARMRNAGTTKGAKDLAHALMYPSLHPGIKWPDENSLPSVAYQSRDVLNITTNSSGIAVVQANTSVNQLLYFTNAATITSTTSALANWTTLNTSTYSDLDNTYMAYRCVGLELRFICTQAPLNVQGSVLFSQLPQWRNGTWQLPSSISTQISTDIEHVIVPVGRFIEKTAALNCRPIDHTMRDFQQVNATQGEGWSSVIMAFFGCTANTQIGSVEVIANWELLLKPGSVAIGVTPASPFSIGALAQAVNYVHGSSFVRVAAATMGIASSYSIGRTLRKSGMARGG